MSRIYTDRSRMESWDKCPRFRFLHYHYDGQGGPGGLEKAREIPPPWPLITGSWFHEGAALGLKGRTAGEAASTAYAGFRAQVQPLIDQIANDPTDPQYPVRQQMEADRDEQSQLVLALVYAWCLVRLPSYLAKYRVVSVEQEEGVTFEVGDREIELLARTDALGEWLTAPGSYDIHNFKTVSTADKTWRQQWRYDQQTLTEYIATENRLGKKINGVVIEGIVKGRRAEYPEGSGQWKHSCPLVWLWFREGEPPMTPPEFYGRYKWACREPHVMGNGKRCPGDKNHSLSGVHKRAAQEVYPGGVMGWVDWLVSNDREIVEQQFVVLEPISRSEFEVERWKRQVLARELMVSETARMVNQALKDDGDQLNLLDHYFPMATGHGNCVRPSECMFLGTCWGSADPTDSGVYRPRTPNHPGELGKAQPQSQEKSQSA